MCDCCHWVIFIDQRLKVEQRYVGPGGTSRFIFGLIGVVYASRLQWVGTEEKSHTSILPIAQSALALTPTFTVGIIRKIGRVTQWLECFLYTEEVRGSKPCSPTIFLKETQTLLHSVGRLGILRFARKQKQAHIYQQIDNKKHS